MVSVPKEMNAVKEVLREIEHETGSHAKLRMGAMIETPAAVANIDEIAGISDFLSIGTNDLIQYAMAAGRENMSMVEYYHEGAETIIKLIRDVVKSAERHSIPCCVCGEMAGEEQYTESLLRAGITELSVTPSRIPFIKEKIRNI
jgi:phosphoenolpyruvate-protein kinase (PTS system EI component)